MSEGSAPPIGPNLADGIPLDDLVDGEPLFGHVGDSPVLLLRDGDQIRAFNAVCTHYGAPLADGIHHKGTVRCPWHHACFSLEDGAILSPPALNPLPRRSVSVADGSVWVGEILRGDPLRSESSPPREPDIVVIVGAGAAGLSAAETLRREGHSGSIVMVDSDPDAPYDRPNLSKDYLAGEAPEEWIPLRSPSFFQEHGIQRLEARVTGIDPEGHTVTLDGERTLSFGALLLATGSRARNLPVQGADAGHVFTLRSLADCRKIIEAADKGAKRAAVIGASFIGMEVAASLNHRGLDVTVIAPEKVPFHRILGEDLGSFLQGLHEDHGVSFRLSSSVQAIDPESVTTADGSSVAADLVVVGVGVEPNLELAREAGLEVGDGVVVDEFLRTSFPDVYAAGDIALYPEPRLGHRVRIEHWVLAQRQGRTAARNILGFEEPFTDVPFFWTSHFGTPVAYVGHASEWDEALKRGNCGGDGCSVVFRKSGKRTALATVYQDQESLRTEVEMEELKQG